MADTGWQFAGTGVADTSYGSKGWINTDRITADDFARAEVSGGATTGTTHYLRASAFGSSVPAGATIDGVEILVNGRIAGGGTSAEFDRVRLVDDAAAVGSTDRAAGATGYYSASYASRYFGSLSDLWGESLSAALVNDSASGTVVAFALTNANVQIDYISRRVYYTEGAALVRALSDVTAAADDVTLARVLARTTAEVAAGADGLARSLDLARAAAGVALITDPPAWARGLAATAGDTAAMAESVLQQTAATLIRLFADMAALSGGLARAMTRARIRGDTSAPADAAIAALALARAVAGLVAAAEGLALALGRTRASAGVVTPIELAAWCATLNRPVSDTAAVLEGLALARVAARAVADAVSGVEAVTPSLAAALVRALDDTLTVAETMARAAAMARSAGDTGAIPELVRTAALRLAAEVIEAVAVLRAAADGAPAAAPSAAGMPASRARVQAAAKLEP